MEMENVSQSRRNHEIKIKEGSILRLRRKIVIFDKFRNQNT
jgi:hypothetical protein